MENQWVWPGGLNQLGFLWTVFFITLFNLPVPENSFHALYSIVLRLVHQKITLNVHRNHSNRNEPKQKLSCLIHRYRLLSLEL